ncbi:MerR family transcriptional regulator [Enterococcus casseliflavus]|uniref:MerR family transcriptional regulator n=1 Tax=Enterococcus casseliflavus TaxID=37734 RepID=UPI00259B6BDC|nr:MerR family transcriptional regulator [uncultured Enterococcus sp.]
MRISEVAKRAELTKKAVLYYCEQGLLFPKILENGYRSFSEADVIRLQTIGLYRKLGLSVAEIKAYCAHPEYLKQIIQERKQAARKLEETIQLLDALADGRPIEELAEEIGSLDKKKTIMTKLFELFPSNYGRLIGFHFSCYLDEPIETKEQQQAFQEIVEFLDTTDPFVLSEELTLFLEEHTPSFTKEQVEEMRVFKEQSLSNYSDFAKNNKEAIQAYLAFKASPAYLDSPLKQIEEQMKHFYQSSGYYEKFIPAMRRVSPSYEAYYQKLLAADEMEQKHLK